MMEHDFERDFSPGAGCGGSCVRRQCIPPSRRSHSPHWRFRRCSRLPGTSSSAADHSLTSAGFEIRLKPLRELRLPIFLSDVDRILAIIGSRMWIGSVFDEQLCHFDIAAARRAMKWRETELLPRVAIGAALENTALGGVFLRGGCIVHRRYYARLSHSS